MNRYCCPIIDFIKGNKIIDIKTNSAVHISANCSQKSDSQYNIANFNVDNSRSSNLNISHKNRTSIFGMKIINYSTES